MKKIQGEGRTRLGRFAAITIPATVITAGMGVAVLQGVVAATVSSADGFQLASSGGLTTDSLKLRPGSTEAGATGHNVATAYAETGANTSLDHLCLGVTQAMPSLISTILPKVGVVISSTSTVTTPNVSLNASSLDGATANLYGVTAGEDQTDADFTDDSDATGGVGSGFGLVSDPAAPGSTGTQDTITGLKATSYAVTLSGLSLTSGLHIGVDADGKTAGNAAGTPTGECF